MKRTAVILILAAVVLAAGGCVGKTVRHVGTRVERGIEFARGNQLQLLGKYAVQRKFVLDENGRLIMTDLFNIKADPKTGKLPATARPLFDTRVAELDEKKDALRDEVMSARTLIQANTDETLKGLALIYQAAEAYGDEDTVNMRLDQLTDVVRILADRIADKERPPAKPSP